jgi:cell division topological specificity factor
VIEFLKRFFGQPRSSATAKERLRLVLMTDHLELAPEMIEKMKRDLVDVISRFVEVDRERIEVSFERQDSTLAMLANIPIVAVNRPNGNGANGNGEAIKGAVNEEPAVTASAPPAPDIPVATPPVRKRRRKKKAQAKAAAPAGAAAQ